MEILNQILPSLDFKTLRNPTQVHTPAVSTNLATDTARAKLVGHGSLRVEGELDGAALAASLKIPFCVSLRTFGE